MPITKHLRSAANGSGLSTIQRTAKKARNATSKFWSGPKFRIHCWEWSTKQIAGSPDAYQPGIILISPSAIAINTGSFAGTLIKETDVKMQCQLSRHEDENEICCTFEKYCLLHQVRERRCWHDVPTMLLTRLEAKTQVYCHRGINLLKKSLNLEILPEEQCLSNFTLQRFPTQEVPFTPVRNTNPTRCSHAYLAQDLLKSRFLELHYPPVVPWRPVLRIVLFRLALGIPHFNPEYCITTDAQDVYSVNEWGVGKVDLKKCGPELFGTECASYAEYFNELYLYTPRVEVMQYIHSFIPEMRKALETLKGTSFPLDLRNQFRYNTDHLLRIIGFHCLNEYLYHGVSYDDILAIICTPC